MNNELQEKEYMMLREEIMFLQKRRESIIQYAYTAGMALFTAAFTFGISWINLCFLPLLISASLRATQYGNSMAYLASYMEIYLEKHMDIHWETLNRKYLNQYPKKGFQKVLHFVGRCDFFGLSLISSLLFWIERDWAFKVHGSFVLGIIVLVVQTFIVFFEAYLAIYYSSHSKHKTKFIENWTAIKQTL